MEECRLPEIERDSDPVERSEGIPSVKKVLKSGVKGAPASNRRGRTVSRGKAPSKKKKREGERSPSAPSVCEQYSELQRVPRVE